MSAEIQDDKEGLTKQERTILRRAAAIITRELQNRNTVRIPGFGKFYTASHKIWALTPATYWPDNYQDYEYIQTFAKFKPFGKLKRAVKNRNKLCKAQYNNHPTWWNNGRLIRAVECYHPDGAGHSGLHIDYNRNEVPDDRVISDG